ncbi:MAG: CPBP family intramembrane metalloprotease [Acidobacteriota bacterium]|nr:CPBP family intramembrane metalloprotease [Acidobacteriota bacterium]
MLEELPESQIPPADPGQLPAPLRPLLSTILTGPDGLRAGWGLLFFLVLFFAMSNGAMALIHAITSHLHHGNHTPQVYFGPTPVEVLSGEGCLALVALLATWIMSRVERRPFLGYGLAPARWLPRLLAGLIWGLGFLSLLVFVLRAAGLLVFDHRALSGATAVQFGAYWFAAFLAVGFFEEIFFRGYMQFTLARGLAGIFGLLGASNRQTRGFWTAAFLVSFGFGFSHSSNQGESPIGLLSASLIGVVFCLSLWRTGSLWWAIGLHAAWDWAQSYLYGVADSGTIVASHLLVTHPLGRIILSGGRTGPEGSIYILPIILMIAIVILLTLPRTHKGYSPRDASDHQAALDLA